MSKKWAWLGVVGAVLAVLAAPSPAFAGIVSPEIAMVAAFVGALVSAFAASIVDVENGTLSWIGLALSLIAVVVSPQFADFVPQAVSSVAALVGAILAAIGGSATKAFTA